MREKYFAAAASGTGSDGTNAPYEHLFSKVALRESELAKMRQPLQQPEKPLLNKLAKTLALHRIGLSS